MIKSFKHGLSEGEKIIVEDMTVSELANRLKCSANSLIVLLLSRGIVANKNQLVKEEQVVSLLTDMGVSFGKASTSSDSELEKLMEAKSSTGEEQRTPVVAVVGHVDHGKTSLLDYLRKTKVAEREKGGITQNVAASEVSTKYGDLVFLDTPGHEAFSLMRERGVLMADLVVLIVALDDGVKPQTAESIKKIQEFGATVVVALNKVDKVKEDRLDIVKRELSEHGILPDEWGGDVPMYPISAKTGQGVEELLEVIRLQADILDLKTSTKEPAQGVVLESMMEHGRGAVASVILHKGKICRGDYFICGKTFGRVSSMQNSYGKRIDCVGPSVPVNIAGFDQLPDAGEMFEFATASQVKKHKNNPVKTENAGSSHRLLDDKSDGLAVIIKVSTLLSKEAVLSSLKKINEKYSLPVKVVDIGIGDINEGNLELAATTGAVVYGLGVKVNKTALSRVKKDVTVKTFDIIYKLLEDVEEFLEKNKVIQKEEKQLGVARVKAIFKIKTVGVIAGAAVESGSLQKGAMVKVLRDGSVVGKGVIKTLQKERTTVNSISEGNDCAFAVSDFSDWKIGDKVQCYTEVEVS